MVEMEPINLVTGLPGAGKTLFGIDLLRKCAAEGLRCFNFNVANLDPELAEPWSGPIDQWDTLPERSVLIVDEAHSVFPKRPTNAATPAHIAALAEIRHKGLRFILIDQDPSTLDLFVKRRVGAHYHLVNRTGYNNARVFSNRGCVDNPRGSGVWSVGESDLWRYPKDLFGRYRSASLHIKRRRIPRMAWVLVGGLTLAVVGAVGAYNAFSFGTDPQVDPAPAQASAAAPLSLTESAQSIFQPNNSAPMTAQQWSKLHTPLVEGVPWSAPIFAARPVTTQPDLHCLVVGDSSRWADSDCRCYTEQATRLQVSEAICRQAATQGVYNPYRGSMPLQPMQQQHGGSTGRGVAAATPPRPVAPVASLGQAQ